MTWLVFYPRTMWRVVAHPAATTHYSEEELTDAPTEQYTDTLSPPLLLMITILIAHGFELGVGAKMIDAKGAVAKALLGSEQNLLGMRALAFSIFALVAALTLLGRRGMAVDRKTLRGPFFSQCYLTAPFALVLSAGLVLVRLPAEGARLAGAAIALAGTAWYLAAETDWFRRQLGVGTGRAFQVAVLVVLKALFYWALLAAALAALMA